MTDYRLLFRPVLAEGTTNGTSHKGWVRVTMKDGNDHIVIFGAGLDALLGDGIDRKYKRMLKSKKDII